MTDPFTSMNTAAMRRSKRGAIRKWLGRALMAIGACYLVWLAVKVVSNTAVTMAMIGG